MLSGIFAFLGVKIPLGYRLDANNISSLSRRAVSTKKYNGDHTRPRRQFKSRLRRNHHLYRGLCLQLRDYRGKSLGTGQGGSNRCPWGRVRKRPHKSRMRPTPRTGSSPRTRCVGSFPTPGNILPARYTQRRFRYGNDDPVLRS